MKTIISSLRKLSFEINRASEASFWAKKIKSRFGLPSQASSDIDGIHWILRETYNILKPVSPELVKACDISGLIFRDDMGPNLPLYPGHGYYREGVKSITLNVDIFKHPDQPDDFFDCREYFLTRASQTLYHEMGHALDSAFGKPSLQPAWMKLSGWSEKPMPGLKRLHIKDEGAPEVIGEMYYDPKIAEFTRFYGKRNAYDDFADCFSFWVAGLKNKVPENKAEYFAKLLKRYY
jgi:hypothetical protein